VTFSESAALSVKEIKDWADEEAECVSWRLSVASRTADQEYAKHLRLSAARHQARARWLYETLAAATIDVEKT
jgi:hypothetical protein